MGVPKWIKPLFVVSGLYDGILGILFLAIPYQLFSITNIAPPNHIGYIQFPALLLIIFGIMFLNISKDPVANRNLILYGILLKIAYCGVVFYNWIQINIPMMWVIFGFFDLIFLGLFIIARKAIKQ